MVLIVTITDTITKNEMEYRSDEAKIENILTSDALKIARVLVCKEKAEKVLGSN